jgi:peptidylprolyl isomerase
VRPTRAFITAGIVAAALAGCGDDDDTSTTAQPEPATTEQTTTEQTTAAQPSGGGAISKDLSQKPDIPKPSGDPPTRLVKRDIVMGKGAAAKAGDQITVKYVGVSFSTGEQFDASWDRGEDFPFQLGAGGVIPGWDQGLVGMRVGGRRELVIPPALAYGETGQGSIGPNETLIFVVDLVDVG